MVQLQPLHARQPLWISRPLEPWTGFGGFEVNFLPKYKALHDAGYNILT